MGGHNAEGGGAVDNNGPGVGSHWRPALVDLSVSGSFEEMRVRAQSRQMQIQNTQKLKRDKRYDSIIVASIGDSESPKKHPQSSDDGDLRLKAALIQGDSNNVAKKQGF